MAVLEHAVRKALERSRLLSENRRYREHLEEEIERRTADLVERSRELEASNHALRREIAQREEAERTLQASEERFRELADMLPQAIFEIDPDGRITFINRFGSETLDLAGEEAGKAAGVDSLFEGADQARLLDKMAGIMSSDQPGRFDTTVRKRDRTTFPAVIYASPILRTGSVAGLRGIIFDITELKKAEAALKASANRLEKENLQLKSSLRDAGRFGRIVGRSPVMQAVYDRVLDAAASSANVIITGESGTGKELIAQTVHELSDRRNHAFITVNCGAVPDNLLESEFFGYRKGSFTGAASNKSGYLSDAHGGTLFLDEIGEIPLNLQVKLLRAIEGGGFSPIGSSDLLKPDIRIIAATNRDLREEVRKGSMREDFYYRIHIIPLHLPPLRDRREDIPLLINHFLSGLSRGESIPIMPDRVVQSLVERNWPGNVRELQNAVHRFITLKSIEPAESVHDADRNASTALFPPPKGAALAEVMAHFERRYLQQVLEENRWHRSRAADRLGIDRRTLFRKIKEYGL
jgi:PAS domain S-box-containing protein